MIAADVFPPDPAGPATYCVNIANALKERGIFVSIVSLNPNSDHSRVNHDLHRVGYRNKLLRYLSYFYLLFKHSSQVDVIYAMGPVNAGLPALVAAKIRGKRLVVKVVGDYAWEQGAQRFGVKDLIDEFQKRRDYKKPVMFLKFIQSLVSAKADKVIVPSKYLKSMVRGWGVERGNIEVVYNAVDVKEVKKFDKLDDEKWIVSVGRLTPWKGMDTLIKLMPEWREVFPNLKLKIISAGPEYDNLLVLIRELGLERAVELTGSLPYEKTVSYIKSGDVFVLNSAYEGLSHVILEALACKRPVAVSSSGGNTELVKQGIGELFDYDDATQVKAKVLKILADPGPYIQKQKSIEWRDFFNQFQFCVMVDSTVNILKRLCQN